MNALLTGPLASEQRGPSEALYFQPAPSAKSAASCSVDVADITTESSSTFDGDTDDEPQNPRRITVVKAILEEATALHSTPRHPVPTPKNPACRNCGALFPLLNMLSSCREPEKLTRALDTFAFLLLDAGNRAACHELQALDVLLDILRRVTDPRVLYAALEALTSLCRHEPRDKMALWMHPNKGALFAMLSPRFGSGLIIEALRVCRMLAFAPNTPSPVSPVTLVTATNATSRRGCSTSTGVACPGAQAPASAQQYTPASSSHRRARSGGLGVSSSHNANANPQPSTQGQHHAHGHHHHHHHHSSQRLLEPALLTVAAELLHPAADAHVLRKALRLLDTASATPRSSSSSSSSSGTATGNSVDHQQPQPCASQAACWHNVVFRLVPLLLHCGDAEVVEGALTVLVNLSEHGQYHNLFYAAGCIPPLLHLLAHKRCAVSQLASCVLSALAEGGLSRDKLCQDTALLAMMRCLQANHCTTVTLAVLYILHRLAQYRPGVGRSLKGWGAVPLLQRLLATTRDNDAAKVCVRLLDLLGAPAQHPHQLLMLAQRQGAASAPPPGAASLVSAAATGTGCAVPDGSDTAAPITGTGIAITCMPYSTGVLVSSCRTAAGTATGLLAAAMAGQEQEGYAGCYAALGLGQGPVGVPGSLFRTISAAATVAATCAEGAEEGLDQRHPATAAAAAAAAAGAKVGVGSGAPRPSSGNMPRLSGDCQYQQKQHELQACVGMGVALEAAMGRGGGGGMGLSSKLLGICAPGPIAAAATPAAAAV